MGKRIVVIGIDGMDKGVLHRFLPEMPTISSLIDSCPDVKLNSTYPYDSETAWSSIYTGLNPAETGVLSFKNPFKGSPPDQNSVTEPYMRERLIGRTIWDRLSQLGLRVCVLFPHACYPSWKVNGTMVCRSSEADKGYPISSYPKIDHSLLVNLDTIRKFPTKKDLKKAAEKSRELLINETAFSLNMLSREKWDFFFLYSSTLDFIQHFFWNYFDINDPTYAGNNSKYQGIIKEFYLLYDKMIAEFKALLDEDTSLIILSDHGHGMRPVKLVNVNEILRYRGLLVPKNQGGKVKTTPIEAVKDLMKRIVSDYQLAPLAQTVFRNFPILKKEFVRSTIVDWKKSVAHVSDPSGIKAYSYGGIVINGELLSADEYEKVRNTIISSLQSQNAKSTVKFLKWVCRREDLYQGECIRKYPDVLFELDCEYGVGWDINKSLLTTSRTHALQPGGHKSDSAVLITYNTDPSDYKLLERGEMTLMDIAPLISKILVGFP
jgi:predicted AlkP superfamily phosphohydrolase/phosphomutase